MVPGALVAAVLAGVLGPVAEKRGYRLLFVPGAIIWALAYVWYYAKVPARRISSAPGSPDRCSAGSASA